MVLSLILLFVAALIIRRGAGHHHQIHEWHVAGGMLVFKSGLSDIAAGDLDSASQKLESIEKPFVDEREWFAYLLIIGAAVFFGWRSA